jgi:hypothetical protein
VEQPIDAARTQQDVGAAHPPTERPGRVLAE